MRGMLRKFARNRPETTSLNHQQAKRRVVIDPALAIILRQHLE